MASRPIAFATLRRGTMYAAVLLTHNVLRWAVLGLGLVFLMRCVMDRRAQATFSPSLVRLSVWFIGALDLQMTLGLALYLWLSPLPPAGFAAVRDGLWSSPVLLFFTVLHPVAMLGAIVAAHLGHAQRKATTDVPRMYRVQIRALVVFLVVAMAAIPWPWFSYGRSLLRGWGET